MVFQIFFSEVPERPLVLLGGGVSGGSSIHSQRQKKKGMFGVFLFFGKSVQPKDTSPLELAVVEVERASPYF